MVENLADLIKRQKEERLARRAQITEQRQEVFKIPEPVVIMNEVACKAIKLLADKKLLLIGLDNGEIKVADRHTMGIFTQQKLLDAPILKIDQQLQAVIVQFKDKEGTISIYKPPSI